MNRRVVVTGLGLVTPVGNSVETTWAALVEGRSGADYIKKFDTEKFPVRFACEVKDFDPLNYIEKKEARKMGAFIHYAIAASQEAVNDSGLQITDEIAENVGTYISSGIGDFWAIEREHEKLLKGGPSRVSPFFIPSAIVNLASGQVSIRHNAKGPNSATATACSAGAHAIGDSFKIIQRGDADAMICGGAESAITPMSVAGFAALRALSTRNDDPMHASRPFDLERDGFVIGEGAGIMILEEYEFARRRGAKIYAEIVGYGMTGDAFHITMPDESGSGAVRVMQKALNDAERETGRSRLHQRARNFDALQRQVRDDGDQENVRRSRVEARHQLDEIDDRSFARRGGRCRRRVLSALDPSKHSAADDQLPNARSGL